ncbi:hypothetical protein WJX81_004843 [Elliptochloris bilobata]|uniref:PH domain-containing protein n=1 Tax=Elliptochloris bilobata TaxID=381761 RepID=A0AAW1RB88_9CHLO
MVQLTRGAPQCSAQPAARAPTVSESIAAALASKLSVNTRREHRVRASPSLQLPARVAAEIETPPQGSPAAEGAGDSGAGNVLGSGDSFAHAVVKQAARLRSAVWRGSERVSFLDIAKNPLLARAARAELHAGNPEAAAASASAATGVLLPEAEAALGLRAAGALDTEAAEESRSGRELAALLAARLDAARRASEKLLGVLQALAAAEAAYTRALTAASRVALAGDCDGAALCAAAAGLADLPFQVGQQHAAVGAGLSDATRGVQEVVGTMRSACADLTSDAHRAHRAMDAARVELAAAFSARRAARRVVERGARGAPEGDPWLGEARCVAAGRAVAAAGTAERELLDRAFARVCELEMRRAGTMRSVVGTLVHAYRAALAALRSDTSALAAAAEEAAAGDSDLVPLAAGAAAAAEAGAALAVRQAEALQAAATALLRSAEIVRQGAMARWVAGEGRWADCHLVLTRAGCLHWFEGGLPTPAAPIPAGSLALARCQLDAGDAERFRLEHPAGMWGRPRTLCFRAGAGQDTGEWVLALRDALAAARAR